MKNSFFVYGVSLAMLITISADASAGNLQTCMDGRYSALCDRSQLSKEQDAAVRIAEHRANLNSCLDGRYPAICRHGDLSAEAKISVDQAEHAANFRSCSDGRYPSLCRHGDLNVQQAKLVTESEHRANLSSCMDGRYPALCRHGDLTAQESSAVRKAEAAVPVRQSTPVRSSVVRRSRGSGCESGHWIDSIMDDGKLVKLEDGSLWKVDDVDSIDSALWLPVTDITVCDGKLINTEDAETVQAEKISD